MVAAADQSSNRNASISVNGKVIAKNVAIGARGAIDECVPVPDGNATLGVTLTTSNGSGSVTLTHAITVHSVAISSPIEGAVLLPADDCHPAGGGFGASVTLALDASLRSLTYTISSSSGSNVTGRVPRNGGAVGACLPLADGMSTISVSVGPGKIMAVPVHVTVTVMGPPSITAVVLNTPAALDPASATYRAGLQTTTWTPPALAGGIQSYELRCSYTPVHASDSDATKAAWWSAATVASTSPATSANSLQLHLRPEEPNHCLLRAADASAVLTPIGDSTDLTTLHFRHALLGAGAQANEFVGWQIAAVGSVDGDDRDDVLVGGGGRALLVFGSTDPSSARSVAFVGSDGGVGTGVAGIGDVDNDGLPDFAISDPYVNNGAGRISVFFGRPQGQWPATVVLDAACGADVCLEGSLQGAFPGMILASAGDFDTDGTPDLAIGSPFYPSGNYGGQLLIVSGAAYESGLTLPPGETFWKLTFDLSTGNRTAPASGAGVTSLVGFRLDSDPNTTGLSAGLVSLGAFDASAGADLAISAPSGSSSPAGNVYLLSGRPHIAVPGFQQLSLSDLGVPIASGSGTDAFGAVLGAVGNLYDVPGAAGTGRSDLGICGVLLDELYIAPGDRAAAGDLGFTTPLLTVHAGSTNIGTSLATSMDPVFGLLGDLDGDGRPDLLSGTRVSHDVRLFYGDRFSSHIDAATHRIDGADGIAFAVPGIGTAATEELMVQYIGDFNGDGHADVVVGDWEINTTSGQAILLY